MIKTQMMNGYGLSGEALNRLFENLDTEKFLASNEEHFDRIEKAFEDAEKKMGPMDDGTEGETDYRVTTPGEYMECLACTPFYPAYPFIRLVCTDDEQAIMLPDFNLAQASEKERDLIMRFLVSGSEEVDAQGMLAETIKKIVGEGLSYDMIAQFVSENAGRVSMPFDEDADAVYWETIKQMERNVNEIYRGYKTPDGDNVIPFPGSR